MKTTYTIQYAEKQIEDAYNLLAKDSCSKEGIYYGINVIAIIEKWEQYISSKLFA